MPCVSRARCKQPGPRSMSVATDSRITHERRVQARRDLPGRFHLSQQPGGDPPLSAAVSGGRVHVLGEHRAALPGPRGLGARSSPSTSTSTTSPNAASGHWCSRPSRCAIQALPHMMSAQWDCLELIMESLARDYPRTSRSRGRATAGTGSTGRWRSTSASRSAMPASLPRQPLDYITRQAQGDFVVMDQREGDLWAEAGMVTTQADWSLDFDVGMTFKEWHGPVPLGARAGRVRPGAQVPAESAPGPAGAPAQLDHDRASAARHLAGELSEVGPRSRER